MVSVKDVLIELTKAVYELSLTNSADETELSHKMWALQERIIHDLETI